jgi:hypothetical protein
LIQRLWQHPFRERLKGGQTPFDLGGLTIFGNSFRVQVLRLMPGRPALSTVPAGALSGIARAAASLFLHFSSPPAWQWAGGSAHFQHCQPCF